MAKNGAPSVDPLKDAFVKEFDETYEGGDPEAGGTEPQEPHDPQSAAPAAAEPTEAPEAVEPQSRQGEAPTADPNAPPEAAAADPNDPFAGTEPFNYDVAGEAKAFDGIYRVPGEGLLVPEDRVNAVQQVFAERDLFDRAAREYQTRLQDTERLATWQTRDAEGREQTLTGQHGLVAMRVDSARLAASFETLSSIFRADPKTGEYTKLLGLLAVDPTGKVTLDRTALDHLFTSSDLAETRAEQAVRAQLERVFATRPSSAASAQPGGASAPTFDYAKDVQPLVTDALKGSVFDPKQFTEKDQQYLVRQLPRFIRSVTEEDRRYNPNLRVGAPIVDASFGEIVKDRAELRAEQRSAAAAAGKAGKFNAGQERGRQPQRQPAKTPVGAPKPEGKTERKKADWDTPFQEFMNTAMQP